MNQLQLAALLAKVARVPAKGKDQGEGRGDSYAYDTQDLNQIQVPSRKWFDWTARCPTILLPTTAFGSTLEGGAAVAGSHFETYYAPNRTPLALPTTQLPEQSLLTSQVSVGCGVVYLPTAGRWSLYYDAPTGYMVQFVIIDASDPVVAARYSFGEGIHRITKNDSDAIATIVDGIVLPSNRLRKGFEITIDAAVVTNAVRLGFNAAATNNAGRRIGIVNFPATYGMSGDNCFKGNVHAIRDATAVADVPLSIIEWI